MHFFEKELSTTDVKRQIAIPSDFMEHLPRYQGGVTISFPVHDASGKVWENFGYYFRREDQDYRKPVFQKDWCKYVRAKGLTSGDKIIFRVEENPDGVPRYTIAAQKRVVVFDTFFGWSEEF